MWRSKQSGGKLGLKSRQNVFMHFEQIILNSKHQRDQICQHIHKTEKGFEACDELTTFQAPTFATFTLQQLSAEFLLAQVFRFNLLQKVDPLFIMPETSSLALEKQLYLVFYVFTGHASQHTKSSLKQYCVSVFACGKCYSVWVCGDASVNARCLCVFVWAWKNTEKLKKKKIWKQIAAKVAGLAWQV